MGLRDTYSIYKKKMLCISVYPLESCQSMCMPSTNVFVTHLYRTEGDSCHIEPAKDPMRQMVAEDRNRPDWLEESYTDDGGQTEHRNSI